MKILKTLLAIVLLLLLPLASEAQFRGRVGFSAGFRSFGVPFRSFGYGAGFARSFAFPNGYGGYGGAIASLPYAYAPGLALPSYGYAQSYSYAPSSLGYAYAPSYNYAALFQALQALMTANSYGAPLAAPSCQGSAAPLAAPPMPALDAGPACPASLYTQGFAAPAPGYAAYGTAGYSLGQASYGGLVGYVPGPSYAPGFIRGFRGVGYARGFVPARTLPARAAFVAPAARLTTRTVTRSVSRVR